MTTDPQPQARPMGLALYRSPRRNLALAALVGTVGALAILFLNADAVLLQIAGAVWFGLCAYVAWGLVERAGEREPVVRIDARGILDTRVSPRPIEWWEIRFFYPLDLSRSRVVELELHHP